MVREFFLNNVGWKLFSLAMAVMIWLIVKGFSSDSSTQTERTFTDLPAQVVSGTASDTTCGFFGFNIKVPK